ncbi:uroporphyrinogen-III C-methyltransferase [Tindallia californiensis]|uniref:uroporphyrinogen-III C-methyltransferase n=1 Tax=Tindallia californiensis TaxID=159292 RepID=A0A1H3MMQ2_9FIRM|nr:uroporphyrinogen-III C-methyltransferase [Tindallia californiensis]SDY77734.1 uroporphyrinogen III methyltransferase / synthase [Tindallia californiensis]
MKQSMVYLVGAGPGEKDLITLRGLNCLKKAEVVLYDRLSGTELLSFAPEDAEFIDVGKKPNHHPVPQEEINRILVKKAKEGKLVVRLKGGDPFVFGRGGEEALALAKEGLLYEIVPGITSSIAVPAYAGIPVTHRHVSPSFHVITGHEDPTQDESLDYEILAKLTGTLIFLMGVGRLERITNQLIEYGKDPNTAVALIHRGTTSEQKTITGRLDNIVDKVRKANLKPPCIIIIGDVVNLASSLQWFENKPLFGKKIMVTRSRLQASQLTAYLKEMGAEVIECPTIEIKPIDKPENVNQVIGKIDQYHHIIFTSVNGVKAFMRQLNKQGMDLRHLSKESRITAVGEATRKKLVEKGLQVDYMPEVFTAEGVLEALTPFVKPEEKVLIPRAELGRKNLIEGLENLGTVVDELVLYKTTLPMENQEKLINTISDKLDWITFTSASTVNHLVEMVGEDYLHLLQKTKLAAIGPITAKAAKSHNLSITCQAEPYTIPALAEAIRKETVKENEK